LRYWAEYYCWTPHVYQRDIAQGKPLSVGTLKTLTLGKETKQKMNKEDLFMCNLSSRHWVAKITNRKGIEKIYYLSSYIWVAKITNRKGT
jgi:hypothetical protein